MPHLPHECDVLQPSKALFNSLPLLLTDRISGVACGPPIDRATTIPLRILGHVRRHVQIRLQWADLVAQQSLLRALQDHHFPCQAVPDEGLGIPPAAEEGRISGALETGEVLETS